MTSWIRRIIVVSLCAHAPASFSYDYEKPTFSLSINILETAAFVALNKLVVAKKEPNLTYLPFHLDGNIVIDDFLAINVGLVYRYENYHDNGPLRSDDGRLRAKKIWTNFHDIFVLAGTRFSIFSTGLDGFYASLKGGLGTSFSPEYFGLSLLLQPELGYTFVFGNPGFHLHLGLGVLGNLPVYETLDFAVPWKKNHRSYGAMHTFVHSLVPILNLGLGVGW